MYETAPGTGCHEKTTGLVGKVRVWPFVGVSATGADEMLLVKEAADQGPKTLPSSSPATRQYRVLNGRSVGGVACRA